METIMLDWSVMPAMMYLPLENFKGKKGFYYPFFGPGIYVFIYPSKVGYQVYYIGQSKEIGSRLASHISSYINPNSGYYIPKSIDYYNEDVYKYFKMEPPEVQAFISNKLSDFPNNDRTVIGEKIMKNTYFGIAKIYQARGSLLREVEYVLHQSVLDSNNLPSYGWFGEKESTRPARNLEVINHYNSKEVRMIIGATLPEKSLFEVEK